VLMGLFIVLVSYASEWAKSAHYDWPDPKAQGWFSLLQSTIRNTLTYVVPTLLGLFAYPVRRRAAVSTFRKYRAQESALMSFVTIASFQWISAFVLHEIFTFLEVSWNISNGYSSSMSDAFRQIWDFTYSFIPCVTLGIFLIGQKLNINQFITSVLIVFIVGVLFSGCDFVSECARVERNNYYMFQLFFGFIVSACLFLVMFISEQPVRGLDLATPAVG
jgi:hypothetical protein